MPGTLRREIKYAIRPGALAHLRQDLRGWLIPDPHGHGLAMSYRVHSLYFDTLDLRLYREKADGEAVRNKLRLRYYDDERHMAFLEIKRRVHGTVHKARLDMMTRSFSTTGLTLPEAAGEKGLQRIAAAGLPLALHPMVQIQYERAAFARPDAPDIRVSLDHDVCGSLYAGGPRRDLIPQGWAILELKARGPVPAWWAVLIRKYGLQEARISKYGLAIDAVHPRFRSVP